MDKLGLYINNLMTTVVEKEDSLTTHHPQKRRDSEI